MPNNFWGVAVTTLKVKKQNLSKPNNFRKRYSWELISNFITNNTAKMQLEIFGRTFRLTSGAIVNATKLTLYWVLSHDAKKRETETLHLLP